MNSKYRPDRQWYARMIQETMDDDFVIGPSAQPATKEEDSQPPITVAFGQLVRFSRRAKKLSAEELAKKLSVDSEEIQQIESDPSYRARPRTISNIASFFDLPLTELMKLAGAAVSNDDAFRSKALKFAAHSDDMAALSNEEQELLRSFIRYLREKP